MCSQGAARTRDAGLQSFDSTTQVLRHCVPMGMGHLTTAYSTKVDHFAGIPSATDSCAHSIGDTVQEQ